MRLTERHDAALELAAVQGWPLRPVGRQCVVRLPASIRTSFLGGDANAMMDAEPKRRPMFAGAAARSAEARFANYRRGSD